MRVVRWYARMYRVTLWGVEWRGMVQSDAGSAVRFSTVRICSIFVVSQPNDCVAIRQHALAIPDVPWNVDLSY